jgi:hypothetical protein
MLAQHLKTMTNKKEGFGPNLGVVVVRPNTVNQIAVTDFPALTG